MASLLTTAQNAALQSAFNDLHDTFAREIYIYKEAKRVVLATTPTFNPIYQQNLTQQEVVERQIQSGMFSARISYDTDRAESYVTSPEIDSQLKIKIPDGTVRIKLDKTGYQYIKKAKRVDFDGRRFSITSDVRPHGLFEPNYYTFFLTPTEN